MKKTIRLTESDLEKIVKRVINEGTQLLPLENLVAQGQTANYVINTKDYGQLTITLSNQNGKICLTGAQGVGYKFYEKNSQGQ
jgi:hypothetical protein